MRQLLCEHCEQAMPMNDMVKVFGSLLCKNCGEKEVALHPEHEVTSVDVARLIDPTICRNCGSDQGNRVLPTINGLPVCNPCEQKYRRRPFPLWIKASLVAMLAMAVFTFIYNWRYFAGYIEINQAFRAFSNRDIARAAESMTSAARHVPEDTSLSVWADYLNGIHLITQDRATEAVSLLQNCVNRFPSNSELRQGANLYLLQAEASAAFDKKEYDTFLAKENELLALQPKDEMSLASVASAYACKYAVTGTDAYKQNALRYLQQAQEQSKDSNLDEYRQRILYRLHTREIIDKKEFDRRFPDGWNPEKNK
jgi:hypothetical protein